MIVDYLIEGDATLIENNFLQGKPKSKTNFNKLEMGFFKLLKNFSNSPHREGYEILKEKFKTREEINALYELEAKS